MEDQVEHLWGSEHLILGPMVRASSLPLRLAALDFGADVVYSEEIPAYRANPNSCVRVVNEVTGTIDFIERKDAAQGSLVLFRTHQEREVSAKCCVLQLGTTDAVTALKAAQLFERDVAAIDINMGCAKHYSMSRGMGAAHMTKPAVAEDIIKTLRRNLSIPVSVKTRLQSSTCAGNSCDHSNNSTTPDASVDVNASVEWLRRLQSAGVQAVALHMRTPAEKTRDAAHMDLFALCHHSMQLNTPLVYNGDMWSRAEAQRLHCSVYPTDTTNTNTDRVEVYRGCRVPIMICRPALWNPSIFTQFKADDTVSINTNVGDEDSTGHKSTHITHTTTHSIPEVLTCLLKHSAATAHCPLNTRYLLQQVLAGAKMLSSETRAEVLKSYNLMSLSNVLGCREFVRKEKVRQKVLWDAKISQQALSCSGGGDDSSVCNSDREYITQYCNSSMWPGVVCKTSHEYNDRYFDDNYYVAFNKPNHKSVSCSGAADTYDTNVSGTNGSASSNTGGAAKRPFSYAGFTESNSTTVRVKKPSLAPVV